MSRHSKNVPHYGLNETLKVESTLVHPLYTLGGRHIASFTFNVELTHSQVVY